MRKPAKKVKKATPKKPAKKQQPILEDSLMSELMQSQYQEINKNKKKK